MKRSDASELAVIRAVLDVTAGAEEESSLLDGVLAVLLRNTAVTDALAVLHDGGRELVTAAAGPLAIPLLGTPFPDLPDKTVILAERDRTAFFPPSAFASGALITVPVRHAGRCYGALAVRPEMNEQAALQSLAALLEIVGTMTADAVGILRNVREEQGKLEAENRKLRDMLAENPGELVGNCREMKAVYTQIRQVAPTDATVLIRGATGTGKELVAKAIVNLSGRKKKPLVALNCAALPESLVESELFGHEKGAFTGATACRIGRVEAADGGTLFLDEIGDLSPATQVKLLRLLQERTFSRVGSNRELHADVRFIAATSRDLEQLMREGKFRADLYYRLNIFPISLPDLCKRRSDIILLADHFVAKLNVRYHKHITRLSTPAINMLMAYHWPGNVRELENCMERAVLTASGDCIHGFDLPPSLQTGQGTGSEQDKASFDVLVASYERELIVEALKRHAGKSAPAARDLDLSPRMIHYYIRKLGITPEWYSGKTVAFSGK